MDTLAIIEAFGVLKQVPFSILLGWVVFVVNEFGFEGVEEAFHSSIIPAIALARHRRRYVGSSERLLIIS